MTTGEAQGISAQIRREILTRHRITCSRQNAHVGRCADSAPQQADLWCDACLNDQVLALLSTLAAALPVGQEDDLTRSRQIGGGLPADAEDDSQRSWRCGCYEDQGGYHFCGSAHPSDVRTVSLLEFSNMKERAHKAEADRSRLIAERDEARQDRDAAIVNHGMESGWWGRAAARQVKHRKELEYQLTVLRQEHQQLGHDFDGAMEAARSTTAALTVLRETIRTLIVKWRSEGYDAQQFAAELSAALAASPVLLSEKEKR